jgi:hypothetical protein
MGEWCKKMHVDEERGWGGFSDNRFVRKRWPHRNARDGSIGSVQGTGVATDAIHCAIRAENDTQCAVNRLPAIESSWVWGGIRPCFIMQFHVWVFVGNSPAARFRS